MWKTFFSFFFFYGYNIFMDYISVVISSFWAIMGQITTIFVPVIVILMLFGILKGLLFDERRY